jgi:integrase
MALLFLIVFMDDEIKKMFNGRWHKRRRPLPWVFLNAKGTNRVKRFYKAWTTACQGQGTMVHYSIILLRLLSPCDGYTFGYNP